MACYPTAAFAKGAVDVSPRRSDQCTFAVNRSKAAQPSTPSTTMMMACTSPNGLLACTWLGRLRVVASASSAATHLLQSEKGAFIVGLSIILNYISLQLAFHAIRSCTSSPYLKLRKLRAGY